MTGLLKPYTKDAAQDDVELLKKQKKSLMPQDFEKLMTINLSIWSNTHSVPAEEVVLTASPDEVVPLVPVRQRPFGGEFEVQYTTV